MADPTPSSSPRTRALHCNHCGALLDAPASVRFLTCGHCDARLQVEHTPDASYTTVLGKVAQIERSVADTASEIEAIRLERKLEVVTTELGELRDPDASGTAACCLVMTIIALGLVFRDDNEAIATGVMGLLIFGPLTLLFAFGMGGQVAAYQETKRALEDEKRSLTAQLEAARARTAAAA